MDTRSQLVAAARDLLVEEGLAGLSMRKVGARCGVSAAAIYRHFPDKDALLASVVGEAFSIFMRYLTEALSESEPLSRFRRMAGQYFAFAAEQPGYYQLIFMTNCEALGLERLDEATKRRASGTFQLLVDRIAECQKVGLMQPGDAQVLAAVAWASLHGVASLLLTNNLDPATDSGLCDVQIDAVQTALQRGTFWADVPAPAWAVAP